MFQMGLRNGRWRRGGAEIRLEAALALRKRDTGVAVVGRMTLTASLTLEAALHRNGNRACCRGP
jgi:hypothetical protein